MLAFDLFDRYGRLKSVFKEHQVKKGSGVWGSEFDSGDLLLIETITLKQPYRRQGLGRKLVTAVLDRTRAKSRKFFVVTAPGWLNYEVGLVTQGTSDEDVKKVELEHQDVAEQFFRSLGFRRVGSSKWLALASDPEHASYCLCAADDFELPSRTPCTIPPEMVEVFGDAVSNLEDEAYCNKLLKVLGSQSPNDAVWHTVDSSGNSILHLAAKNSKPLTVKAIVTRNSSLLELRNDQGETPLDSLQSHLEDVRTRRKHGMITISTSDNFQGFSNASTSCLELLMKPTMALTPIQKQRLRFGCTCGRCVAGFLSPRMRFALRNQAEYQHDILTSSIEMENGEDFVSFMEEPLQYVPPSVRNNMRTNKSLRQGFANLFTHFATCLRKESFEGLPITDHVLSALENASEWPPCSKNYLQRGGTIYAVGSCLFESAMNEDELAGDGNPLRRPFEELDGEYMKDLPDFGLGAELESLPECRNDLEYGFVSVQCGYKMVSREYYDQ